MSKNIYTKNYRAWSIRSENFPYKSSIHEQCKYIAAYGLLAPSTHNTQPWQIKVKGDSIIITPDNRKRLIVGDPDGLGLLLSVGACVENVVQAARSFGLRPSIEQSAEVVTVKIDGLARRPIDDALDAITGRSSFKLLHGGKVAREFGGDLESLNDKEFKLSAIYSKALREEIIKNHVESARDIASNPNFAYELSNWLRPNRTSAVDGMPGFTTGASNAKAMLAKFILRKKPEILQKMAIQDATLLRSSPVFVIFSSSSPIGRANAIEAGRFIERAWLKLTNDGLVAHPMYASIQSSQGRARLGKILALEEYSPYFFMRVGKPTGEIKKTPRDVTKCS
jgi:hypothetical protein